MTTQGLCSKKYNAILHKTCVFTVSFEWKLAINKRAYQRADLTQFSSYDRQTFETVSKRLHG